MQKHRKHWSAIQESTSVFGIWFLYYIYRIGGRTPLRLIFYPVVFYFWITRRDARQASLEYLQRLQQTMHLFAKPPGWRQSLRHFFSFAEAITDKLLAMSGRYDLNNVEIKGRQLIEAELNRKRGGLMVTAHIGCLELCQCIANLRPDLKLNILVHLENAERFNRILRRLNPAVEMQLVSVTDISPATAQMLQRKIDAGEFVVIAGDRTPVSSNKTVSAEFLGKLAPLPIGPYVLASILECPLFFMGCIRQTQQNNYLIYIDQLAQQVVLPRAKRMEVVAELAQLYIGKVEALLCRSPYDWFNFFAFWNTEQRHVSK